jgi:hypothetical protein
LGRLAIGWHSQGGLAGLSSGTPVTDHYGSVSAQLDSARHRFVVCRVIERVRDGSSPARKLLLFKAKPARRLSHGRAVCGTISGNALPPAALSGSAKPRALDVAGKRGRPARLRCPPAPQ